MSSRIDLKVPFAEKNDAKQNGARWDADRRVWYVPDGVDATPLSRWLPKVFEGNVRASRYYIAESQATCWKCGERTRVFGFVLPPAHEVSEPVDEEDAGFGQNDDYAEADYQAWLNSPASSSWVASDEPTIVHYIAKLLPSVATRIKALSTYYRVDFSQTTKSSYWMNHCEHCGMKQGDFGMFNEPQGAFFPMTAQSASTIGLHPFSEPFVGECGSYSYGVEFFEHMRPA